MTIPFMDLSAQYLKLKPEIDRAIADSIETCSFVGGKPVSVFEEAFADYCEAKSCAAVGNGTDALTLALRALGVGVGDEVITVPNTFIATSEAIGLVGASPVFVDVDINTLLMDPQAVEEAITPKTKAIIPVHLFGQSCDMDAIMGLANKHHLYVVEDSAQAHGARWKGQRVGTFGNLGCFSFYPGKNLGAYGDAGAVVGNDAELVKTVRRLANHGRESKYLHDQEGTNSRLDAIQARILCAKLPHLDHWNTARRERAGLYAEKLFDLEGLTLTDVSKDCEAVWHLFTCRVKDRDGLREHLSKLGIASGVHYPVPLHRQPAYAHLGLGEGSFPVAERAAAQLISLPMYPEMPLEWVDQVCKTIGDYFANNSR